jgi:Fibronectin type III domain
MSIYPPTPPRSHAGTAIMMPLRAQRPTGGVSQPPPATPQLAYPPAVTLAQIPGSVITVTWPVPVADSSHDAANSYNLQYSPSGADTWTLVSGINSPYVLSGTIPGASIDVQMQSVNAAGASAWSVTGTTATIVGVPNSPAGVSLAQGSGSSLVATWVAPTGDSAHGVPTSFNLQYSRSGVGAWNTVAGVTSPYTLSGLTPAAAYDIQVESSNAAGASSWSAISTFTTASAAPNVPASLALAQGLGSDLTVTWAAPATDSTHGSAATYNLRSSPSGSGTWTVVSNVTSPYDLSGLAASAAIDIEVQSANSTGSSAWSAISTMTTRSAAGPYTPNVPAIAGVAPPPDGTTTKLTVTWTAPATDSTHSAATGYTLRYGPTGAGTWTTVTGVTSPYTLTGLAGASAFDVELQASNAAASPSAWSAITTGKTWGATVVPGNWIAAATQVHGVSVAPNGGVQLTAVAAPTAVTGAVFAWSASATTLPTTALIVAGADGQTNGWGQYINAPATAGTYYLWMIAQGAGSATIGALVTSAITVS